jgi:hypothetical protein
MINTQQLAEQHAEVLGVAVRVACTSPVPGAEVQQAVGAEQARAALVIREGRMRDGQDRTRRERVSE